MQPAVRVRGRGRVEVAAYGVADAEHLVEKELARCWPGARCTVLEVARSGEGPAIVEEFTVAYQIEGRVPVEGDSPQDAARAALRRARSHLSGTRYAHTALEVVESPADTQPGG